MRITYLILLPVLLLPIILVFNVRTPSDQPFLHTRQEFDENKLLTAAKKEIERLAQKVEEITASRRDAETQLRQLQSKSGSDKQEVIIYTPDPSDVGGTINVLAAAIVCNCPTLVNGAGAQLTLQRMAQDTYIHTFNHREKAAVAAIDITNSVIESCSGKENCVFKITEDQPIAACNRDKLTLDCNTPREIVQPPRKHVEWVRPVKYTRSGNTFEIWPMGFSIPAGRFTSSVGWKDNDFADLIPGNTHTYTHSQRSGTVEGKEPDVRYFHNYRHSYYCVTRKKKGWDCLRHYEILASGCIPYFVDIDRLPANTMTWFPKKLVEEAMNLPGVHFNNDKRGAFWFKESYSIDHSVFNKTRYYELAAKIHNHAKRYLTSEAMASYVLKALHASGGLERPKRVLYIHHCYHDFMGDALWTGFKDLEVKGYLEEVVDIVTPANLSSGGEASHWGKLFNRGDCVYGRKRPLMTSDATLSKSTYYGWVNGWGNHRAHNYFPEESAVSVWQIEQRLREKWFDVIVYATPEKTAPWLDIVAEKYPKEQVAFTTGGDLPEELNGASKWASKGVYFSREIYDEQDDAYLNKKLCYYSPGIAEVELLDCCQMEEMGRKIIWSKNKNDTDRWKPCGKENAVCVCSTHIRFGDAVAGKWHTIDLEGIEKNTKCNNVNTGGPFTDPSPGAPKECQCKYKPADETADLTLRNLPKYLW